MNPDSATAQPANWLSEHPWLTELTHASADQEDDTMDETTRYALDEMRIA